MEKKKITNLLKLGVFLFGISLLLWSCESDEISSLPEQHSSTTNFKITTLNSEQISKNEKVKEILKKSKKYENSLKAKSVTNYQDFYIDTSFSKYVESSDGTQHSYTFLIDRNNNTLENLLLSSNNQGGYNTYIVSYGFSSQEKANMNFNDFSSKEVIIKPIDFDASQIIINIQAKTQQLVCIDSQKQVKVGCCSGDLCRGESSDCIINGGTGYYYEWVTTSSTCEWVTSEGGDNDSSSTADSESTSTSGGDSSTTTVLIDTTPYTTDLKQFVSGTLNLATEGVKSYYTSDNNIYNTINKYLIQKGFSDFSKFEAMLNLEFGFSLGLNPQSFVWAFNNKESEEVKAVKDFLAVNITTEAKAFALKAINNKSTKYINENFEFTKKSPFNVDMTQVLDSIKLPTINPENKIAAEKFKCIYDKVTKSPKFKDLFIDLFGTNKDINVTFEIANDFVTKPNGRQANGNCGLKNYSLNADGSIKTANVVIKINKNKLTTGSGREISNILMAKTIVHESIHAFLDVKRKDCNAGITIEHLNNLEFEELIKEYFDGTCATAQEEHEFMFNYLVGTLAPILAEVRNDLISASQITKMENESLYIGGTDVPFKWDDFFYNLSLEGLHNTEAFKNKIASDINKYDTFKEYINYYAKNFDKNCN